MLLPLVELICQPGGECELGQLNAPCLALDLIRAMEESPSQGIRAPLETVVLEPGEKVSVGSGSNRCPVQGAVMSEAALSPDNPEGLVQAPVVPVPTSPSNDGSVQPSANVNNDSVISQSVQAAVVSPGSDGVAVPVLSSTQEAQLVSALHQGRSFAKLAEANVRLDHFYGQYGAQAFRHLPGSLDDSVRNANWDRGMGGPERKRRNVVQLRWQGEESCPSRDYIVDLELELCVLSRQGFG